MKIDSMLFTRYIILFFCLIFSNNLHSQDDISLIPENSGYIEHDFYLLSYNENHEQSNWVYYTLDNNIINGKAERKNNFKEDPLINSGSAKLSDYRGSGYDRGHLCPAAAMKINQKAMDETFYMSNMSPQKPSFNRGIWKKLESLIRKWVYEYDKLYVVTGPILEKNLQSIGSSKVSIPNYFFKAIYSISEKKMIGFIIPNEKSDDNLSKYKVSVDNIENRTGLNLFEGLEDEIETRLESTISEFKFLK